MQSPIDAAIDQLDEMMATLDGMKTDINRGGGGREVALAVTNLQVVRYWLTEAKRLQG